MLEAILLSVIGIVSLGNIYHTVYTSSSKKNQNWETKIREMVKLFDGASNHIQIVTDLSHEFFADQRVLNSLQEAAKRGVQIKIVYDPAGCKLEELKDLQKLVLDDMIEAKKANQAFTKETVRHVMEVDGAWARLEAYHPAKHMLEAKAGARIYRSPVVAHYAGVEFNRVWENSLGERG